MPMDYNDTFFYLHYFLYLTIFFFNKIDLKHVLCLLISNIYCYFVNINFYDYMIQEDLYQYILFLFLQLCFMYN